MDSIFSLSFQYKFAFVESDIVFSVQAINIYYCYQSVREILILNKYFIQFGEYSLSMNSILYIIIDMIENCLIKKFNNFEDFYKVKVIKTIKNNIDLIRVK